MPKKHTPSYAQTKPSYVHPSLQSSRPSSSSVPSEPQSVNQRIQQLRREQAPRAAPSRRDEVTEVVTSHTLPPNLRRLLHLAEVDAPKPKPGTRSRTPRAGARPPPGPAAPSSWLRTSRHAPEHIRNLKRKYGTQGPTRFCALAQEHDAEFKRLPSPRSLACHCLRTFAIHWNELAEYEQHYLPALPIPLKEVLLSYLSLYGNRGCLDFRSFKILFQDDTEVQEATGSQEIRFLDLTGLLNQEFTLKDLGKCLHRSLASSSVTSGLAGLSLDNPSPASPKHKEKAPSAEVAESWEDEIDESMPPSGHTATVLPAHLSIPVFKNLTRLSLAHPGPSASWVDLLSISPNLKTLTHLSLAYWPRPSTTPNAATTSMASKIGASIPLGGSHFYSDLDDDWHEAANILRRFSLNTYCLKWLDLEGCTWYKALTWDPYGDSSNPSTPQASHIGDGEYDEWRGSTVNPGPDWNSAWRQIEYLNLSQGWIPSNTQALQVMPAGVIPARLLGWLRENREREDVKDKLYGEAGYVVNEWVDREKVNRSIGVDVHLKRKAGEGKYCFVDYGWGT